MNTVAMNDDSRLLDKVEMSKLLKISERHLFNLTKGGKIPSVRLGDTVRYDRADVWAAIKGNSK